MELGSAITSAKATLDVLSQEPTHYLCQPCYEAGAKVVLRHEDSAMLGLMCVCPMHGAHSFHLGAAHRTLGRSVISPGV